MPGTVRFFARTPERLLDALVDAYEDEDWYRHASTLGAAYAQIATRPRSAVDFIPLLRQRIFQEGIEGVLSMALSVLSIGSMLDPRGSLGLTRTMTRALGSGSLGWPEGFVVSVLDASGPASTIWTLYGLAAPSRQSFARNSPLIPSSASLMHADADAIGGSLLTPGALGAFTSGLIRAPSERGALFASTIGRVTQQTPEAPENGTAGPMSGIGPGGYPQSYYGSTCDYTGWQAGWGIAGGIAGGVAASAEGVPTGGAAWATAGIQVGVGARLGVFVADVTSPIYCGVVSLFTDESDDTSDSDDQIDSAPAVDPADPQDTDADSQDAGGAHDDEDESAPSSEEWTKEVKKGWDEIWKEKEGDGSSGSGTTDGPDSSESYPVPDEIDDGSYPPEVVHAVASLVNLPGPGGPTWAQPYVSYPRWDESEGTPLVLDVRVTAEEAVSYPVPDGEESNFPEIPADVDPSELRRYGLTYPTDEGSDGDPGGAPPAPPPSPY